jgi:hypothetical protein
VNECDTHHLVPFSEGGPTDLANGARVCPGHHDDITKHRAHLARGPNGTYTYTAPDGTTHTETDLT